MENAVCNVLKFEYIWKLIIREDVNILRVVVQLRSEISNTVSTVLTAALLFKSSFVGAGLKREFT